MADKHLTLDIVTPSKVVYSGEVLSFSAPGTEGGFQVLVNHAPLLSSLTVGQVKITDAAGKEFHYATSGGFVEVKNNKVILLAETAERSDEIDIKRAEEAKRRAHERLQKEEQIDEERARAALIRAINRLKIAGSN
ncbi:MAG TPA: F0F1 ATP synthase subunit epsilon [Bacteroidota bacterium]|nr:F0F1 ATP synthase subunit epsilon [Bacteroidota bacterium]